MREYHKINSIYKRDEKGQFLLGQFSAPEFQYLARNPWMFTEKVDGTNIRIGWSSLVRGIEIGGRTDRAQIPVTLLSALNALELEKKMYGAFPDGGSVVLYGEGYGAGIQKGGGNYRPTPGFVLFDVTVNELYLNRIDVEDVAQKLGLDIVPVRMYGTLYEAEDAVKRGITSVWGNFEAEGLVGTPTQPLRDRRGNRIIIKIKGRDYKEG